MSGYINVFECSFALRVGNKGVMLFIDIVKIQILVVMLLAAVSRCIVDDYRKIVGIVLAEQRVEVVLYSEPSVVVVSRHHHTHRQLFNISIKMPNRVQPPVLLTLHLSLLFLAAQV